MFVGDGFIVVVRHGQASALSRPVGHIETDPSCWRCGPGAVLHAIVDSVVDDYGR